MNSPLFSVSTCYPAFPFYKCKFCAKSRFRVFSTIFEDKVQKDSDISSKKTSVRAKLFCSSNEYINKEGIHKSDKKILLIKKLK
ncbi:hypothetical protein D3797_000515 [Bacillus subtilis]|nr:hypothetical protein D3797_000515 [Bacillus subtilis]